MRELNGQLPARICLQHARMLVPKFAFEHEGGWHIQWPKDQPHVIHAKSEKELIIKLATQLQKIGRVANHGTHVEPEYP